MPAFDSIPSYLRPIIWLVLLFIYMAIGGAIFQATESEIEHWDYLDSCLYAMSVFTTTGYGFKTPITKAGKSLTFLYAVVGIPLFIKYLYVFGSLVNSFNTFVLKRLCSTRSTHNGFKFLLAVLEFLLFHPLSAAWHMRGSEWEFLDSMYFTFISLSTIGFGDLYYAGDIVEGTGSSSLNLIFSVIVLFIGYALLGALGVAGWNFINSLQMNSTRGGRAHFVNEEDGGFQNPTESREMSTLYNEPSIEKDGNTNATSSVFLEPLTI